MRQRIGRGSEPQKSDVRQQIGDRQQDHALRPDAGSRLLPDKNTDEHDGCQNDQGYKGIVIERQGRQGDHAAGGHRLSREINGLRAVVFAIENGERLTALRLEPGGLCMRAGEPALPERRPGLHKADLAQRIVRIDKALRRDVGDISTERKLQRPRILRHLHKIVRIGEIDRSIQNAGCGYHGRQDKQSRHHDDLQALARQPFLQMLQGRGVRSGLQGRRGLCLLQGGAAVRTGAQVLFYKGSGLRTRKPLGIQREKVPHNAAFLIHVDPSMFFRMMVLAR